MPIAAVFSVIGVEALVRASFIRVVNSVRMDADGGSSVWSVWSGLLMVVDEWNYWVGLKKRGLGGRVKPCFDTILRIVGQKHMFFKKFILLSVYMYI
jgi:hypothetical protein